MSEARTQPRRDDGSPDPSPVDLTTSISQQTDIARFVDWFVPAHLRDNINMRQRIHIFTVSHFFGAVPGVAMAYFLSLVSEASQRNFAWVAPLYLLASWLPFGFKIVPRLEVVGAISAQLFAFTVLITARYYNGLLSPALPWLAPALSTGIYYLQPWPTWRAINVSLQLTQIAVFVAAALYFPPGISLIPPDRLPEVELISAFCAIALMSVISMHIWSMDVAKQKQLDQEMAARQASQAERDKSEHELRRSRDHLAQSQRVGKMGSAEITLKPEYAAQWSDALFELFGLAPSAVAPDAEQFIGLVHPEDRGFVRQRRDRERRGEYGRASEFRIVRPDGQIRWLRRQAEPIEWEHGKPKREIIIFIDITEQKDASDALARLEEMLAQAQKMEAIGQLTGGIAHDFNNLLGVILGMLRLMEEELDLTTGADFEDIGEWLDACIRAVNRGASLTKSMLAFSRRQSLTPVALDANSVVDEMVNMLRRALGESYQLDVVKAAGLWTTEADASQLQNAVLNLVLNARDAVPEGGTLTIETRNVHLEPNYAVENIDQPVGDYVELSVADKGIGMPPDVLKRAFDPFFTTKEVGKGTGLGLSMVYGFVKQSGGHVTIDSAINKGTTVRILLPRREKKVEAAPTASRPSAPAPTEGGTILVVEDNPDLLAVTRMQLERMGFDVVEAADAVVGLEKLRANPHTRLLVSDVVLPNGISGVELAERALNEFPQIKIVFMSGHNDEHQAFDRIRGRMPIALLQKPFQPNELAAQIRSALA